MFKWNHQKKNKCVTINRLGSQSDKKQNKFISSVKSQQIITNGCLKRRWRNHRSVRQINTLQQYECSRSLFVLIEKKNSVCMYVFRFISSIEEEKNDRFSISEHIVSNKITLKISFDRIDSMKKRSNLFERWSKRRETLSIWKEKRKVKSLINVSKTMRKKEKKDERPAVSR